MRVLPEDLVAKCLAMLPQCDLQKRCVCKRWRELRLSPAFPGTRKWRVDRAAAASGNRLHDAVRLAGRLQC